MKALENKISTKGLKTVIFLMIFILIGSEGLLEPKTMMVLSLIFLGIAILIFGILMKRNREIENPEKKIFSKKRLYIFYGAMVISLMLGLINILGIWPFVD